MLIGGVPDGSRAVAQMLAGGDGFDVVGDAADGAEAGRRAILLFRWST